MVRLPPLYVAAVNGYLETVKLLLEHGADADGADRFGRTALSRLATDRLWHPAHPVMNRLIAHGASVDLTAALSMGDAGRVRELVAANGGWKVLQLDTSDVPLFDGTTLQGWRPLTDGWTVKAGEIVCPTSSRVQFMVSENLVGQPFRLRYQVAATARHPGDGKMAGIVDAAGNNVLVALDDDRKHAIQIDSGRKTFDEAGVYGVWRLEDMTELEMELGKWYDILITVDGSRVTAATGGAEISCPFKPEFPVFIWLEVPRTGARYRDLLVTKL